jgi:hypothetical protein
VGCNNFISLRRMNPNDPFPNEGIGEFMSAMAGLLLREDFPMQSRRGN